MLQLVDITGTERAPECPHCKKGKTKAGLVQMEELGIDMQKSGGVWRCQRCFHAFAYKNTV